MSRTALLVSRILQPVATAVTTLALLGITLYFRPFSPAEIHAARAITSDGTVEMLPRAETVPQPPYDSSFDSLVLTVWLSGLSLILLGSLYLIWFRARTVPGRHRAAA